MATRGMKRAQILNLMRVLALAAHANVSAAPAAITVNHIAPGGNAGHTLFIQSDGSLWGMGPNYVGQLGDGSTISPWQSRRNTPEMIVSNDVVAAAVGVDHSLFLKSDGSLWATGYNIYGQLGDGTTYATNRPERIVAGGVIAIAAGYQYSLFIKSDGSLWGMGNNSFGQLGINTSFAKTPQRIVSHGVKAIAAAAEHSLFLKTDGSVWAMGCNDLGQLGDGTDITRRRPVQIVSPDGRFIADQRAGQHQGHGSYPRSRVIAVAAGGDYQGMGHSLFLMSDGSLRATGCNYAGQLGNGPFELGHYSTNRPEQIVASNVVAIAAGSFDSLFLKSDGSLWAMGRNLNGQLGNGTLGAIWVPEEIVSNNVAAMSAANDHSLFLKSDGSLWGMGYQAGGALGDGFWSDGSSGLARPEQIWPRPQPVLAATVTNGTDLQFTAPCGFGGDFCLLTSTNLNQPPGEWTPVATNTIYYRYLNLFSVTLPDAAGPGGPQFYILQSR